MSKKFIDVRIVFRGKRQLSKVVAVIADAGRSGDRASRRQDAA
jgi:hypothetical protein